MEVVMISKNKLDQLVAEFRHKDESGSYEQQRADWWSHFTFDVTSEWIEALTEEKALRLYKNTGWGVKLYQRTFRENGLERIKASLIYLLYSDDPIEERFFNVVDRQGSHKLHGTGREFASFLLCMHDNQQYGIWNGPVDDGLNLLKMIPRRERGEHIGQTYAKVVTRLKELQELGGFDDLQFVDEFLELLAKGFIGRGVLGREEEVRVHEEELEEFVISEEAVNQHTKMQWLLIRIGLLEGHGVWVASGDKGKVYEGERLGDRCLSELPHFAGPGVMDIARYIDVIWFKQGTASPVKFFEIEHSTSIYSGLLRMNDVIIDYPLPEAMIVASAERKPHFEKQVGRRTFNVSGLAEVCRFMAYDEVEKLYKVELVREQLL
jgi:hypothetical protein